MQRWHHLLGKITLVIYKLKTNSCFQWFSPFQRNQIHWFSRLFFYLCLHLLILIHHLLKPVNNIQIVAQVIYQLRLRYFGFFQTLAYIFVMVEPDNPFIHMTNLIQNFFYLPYFVFTVKLLYYFPLCFFTWLIFNRMGE